MAQGLVDTCQLVQGFRVARLNGQKVLIRLQGIRWPLQGEPILADKDRRGTPLKHA